MDPLPFVSVCLLTYKRASILRRSLDSLLAQTHSNFELIINDDNSPDDTEAVCREYERRDGRVRYCRNVKNLRYAGNQNAAVARAKSDYVAIVHDGDVYRPDLIEKWTRGLASHPSAALVFNALEAMDLEGNVVKVYRHPYPPLIPGAQLFEEMLRSEASPIFGIVMVRKSCLESVGPFDTSLPVLADVDMWLRLLQRYDAAYIAEPLLRVAAREIGHANLGVNWKIQDEHERIYAMNLARRARTAGPDPRLEATVRLMLWRRRLRSLAWCVRYAEPRKLLDGLTFVVRKPALSERSPW